MRRCGDRALSEGEGAGRLLLNFYDPDWLPWKQVGAVATNAVLRMRGAYPNERFSS